MRPNKRRQWSLEQRKVSCRATQRGQVTQALKSSEPPKGFSKALLRARVGQGLLQGL